MIIKNIESKIRINKVVSIIAILASVVISITSMIVSANAVSNASKNIYVLDGDIPLTANRTDINSNREAETKAHINLFHNKFFTLTPDDDYIKKNSQEALYLIDDSGLNEHINLKERGFYNQIISSNSVMTIRTDSINTSQDLKEFKFYGKQVILRKSTIIIRNLESAGKLREIPRTPNNPHGIIIQDWKILDNTTLQESNRY